MNEEREKERARYAIKDKTLENLNIKCLDSTHLAEHFQYDSWNQVEAVKCTALKVQIGDGIFGSIVLLTAY